MITGANTDERLITEMLRRRDSKAMRYVYDRYAGLLTAVCARYIVSDDDVKDVLQDSFIRIFTAADRFEYRGEGSLKAWMTQVVVRESLKFLRDSGRHSFISYDERLPEAADEEEPDIAYVPTEAIEEMIKTLPDGYRTVFNLFVFERKSHREIAALLNIKESSSASQLHRAKAILARMINDYKRKACI